MLKDRVQARLEELAITPSEAARRGDLERTFIADILLERKKNVRGKNLEKLAVALDCSPEYLSEVAERPGLSPLRAGLPLVGIIEAKAYRVPMKNGSIVTLPVYPDGRYDADEQIVFRVAGDEYAERGIPDGSYIVAMHIEPFRRHYGGLRDNMLVVTRCEQGNLEALRLNRVRVSERGVSLIEPCDSDDCPLGETPIAVALRSCVLFL